MLNDFIGYLKQEINKLKESGYHKGERLITSPQGSKIQTNGKTLINLCSNNYLGLANHPRLIASATQAIVRYGFGLSSVRFICGTQDIHKHLERELARFLGTEDCILYSSCFDANAGVFEALFSAEDAIISDSLNHASIIDGVRLCKAGRFRYENSDMIDLEKQLVASQSARFRIIVTDGVFSMDGIIANLREIVCLAEKYEALVMVDDSHAVGFVGPQGRGTPELCGVIPKIDILTGTLGKALGGASGGYCAGRKEMIEWLREKSRPYLFSNSLAPVIAATSVDVLEYVQSDEARKDREKLWANTRYFRKELEKLNFRIVPGEHPIVPILLGDAKLAKSMSEDLFAEGIYAIAFSYPVVPQGKARIRTQLSASHSKTDLADALMAFQKVGKKLGVI